MKNYLVAVALGGGVIRSYTVQTPKDYLPEGDGCKLLREKIVKKHSPCMCQLFSRDGRVEQIETNTKLEPNGLTILAVSNLGV